jgi:hypothetical protein
LGGKTIEGNYAAAAKDVYEAARRAVADLGYTVLHTEADTMTLSFNTGPSMKSISGQDLTASLFAQGSRTRLVVGGSLSRRSNPTQL